MTIASRVPVIGFEGGPMSGVKLEDGRRVISAAEKKAKEIGQPMNIAVADKAGNLVAHVRMDNVDSQWHPRHGDYGLTTPPF